jgi:hypothetical protein
MDITVGQYQCSCSTKYSKEMSERTEIGRFDFYFDTGVTNATDVLQVIIIKNKN